MIVTKGLNSLVDIGEFNCNAWLTTSSIHCRNLKYAYLKSSHIFCVQVLVQAGLLNQEDITDEMTEFWPRHSTADVTEMQRHERFSFAVARTLDLTNEQLQHGLETTKTHERLQMLHDELADGRGYLAARNSLKGLL